MIRKNRVDYDCTIPIESRHCHSNLENNCRRAGQPVTAGRSGAAPPRSLAAATDAARMQARGLKLGQTPSRSRGNGAPRPRPSRTDSRRARVTVIVTVMGRPAGAGATGPGPAPGVTSRPARHRSGGPAAGSSST